MMRCATVRFLDLVKPFVPFLPEVQQPETKIAFNTKLMWTGLTCQFLSLTLRLKTTSYYTRWLANS
jgi:hypothetical protein